MKPFKKCVAMLIVFAMLCSLACVCTLYAYPTHIHTENDAHCTLCNVAANGSTLLQSADALAVLFWLILGLVCLGTLYILRHHNKPRRVVTLVTLKAKLSW